MGDLILKLLSFFNSYIPLLSNTFIILGIILLIHKSIKRHAKVYYFILSIPLILLIMQMIIETNEFSFLKQPIIRPIILSYIHIREISLPLLIIIMYMGALNPKIKFVKNLMNIRKELSIICGFPVLTHILWRVTGVFIMAVMFFISPPNTREAESTLSLTAQYFSNTGYVLGIFMAVLFIMLWITSFDSIHRRLGNKKWKKIQKWSYLLYALLFIHSMLLNIGWLIHRIEKENVDGITKSGLAIATTLLIFTSYLILRLRKAKKDKAILNSVKQR